MLLAMDIGNTHSSFGIFQDEKIVAHWRITSSATRTVDESWILINQLCMNAKLTVKDITSVIICSVVPNLTFIYERMARLYLKIEPVTVSSSLDVGLTILYKDPGTVGADRICNAVAGKSKYPLPLIIVDFGTATTFDIISGAGEYLGGIIAPGVETSAIDLFRRAAKLPRVEFRFPERVIGKTTETSMQSGILYGTVEQVNGLIERIEKELGQKPCVIATGGFSELIGPYSEKIEHIDPLLTLEGLQIIHEIVKKRHS